MRGAKSRLPGGASGSAGKDERLFAGNECGDLVVLLIPRLDAVPAQAVIQSKAAVDAPAILRVQANVFVAAVKRLQLALIVLAGNPEQKIGEVQARFGAKEEEAAIELRDGIDVHWIVVGFAAKFQRVPANLFGKIVEPLKRIFNLIQLVRIGADRVAVESNALDAFGFRRQRHDSGGSRTNLEPL